MLASEHNLDLVVDDVDRNGRAQELARVASHVHRTRAHALRESRFFLVAHHHLHTSYAYTSWDKLLAVNALKGKTHFPVEARSAGPFICVAST